MGNASISEIFLDRIIETLASLEILLGNTGIAAHRSFHKIKIDDKTKVFDIVLVNMSMLGEDGEELREEGVV